MTTPLATESEEALQEQSALNTPLADRSYLEPAKETTGPDRATKPYLDMGIGAAAKRIVNRGRPQTPSLFARQARHPIKAQRQATRDCINANGRCWPMPWPSGTPGQRLSEKDGPRGGSGRRNLLCPTDPCPVPWGSVPWLAMHIDALPQWAAGLP